MKPETKKNIIISYIVIGLLLIFNNFFLPYLNLKEYSFDAFQSDFFNAGDKKIIDSGTAGRLAFGPFIGCSRGQLRVKVVYSGNSSGSTVDIYSDNNRQVYAELELPENQNSVTLEADIPADLSDMEIRVHYSGNGALSLDKAVVSERINDLNIIILIYDIIFVVIVIGITAFIIKKKDSRT